MLQFLEFSASKECTFGPDKQKIAHRQGKQ